jgi:terminal uridylyltransferase
MTSGELWIAFLRYYTEQFNYEKNVITIRQYEPLQRFEKGWFHQTIAIEDPFILNHNLADKLSLQSKY